MGYSIKKLVGGTFCVILIIVSASGFSQGVGDQLPVAEKEDAGFDFDSGDASVEVVVPNVVSGVYDAVGSGNATFVLRITTFVTNAWFDSTAPYHDTAVGIYSSLGRRPASEVKTNRNMNIAIVHASYHVLMSLLPEQEPRWRNMMLDVGLNPDSTSVDMTSPEGIGNLSGKAIIATRINDGMNQLGDAGGKKYNRIPYSDYTNYRPQNTAYELRRPSRWQPRLHEKTRGTFAIQKFVTPHFKNVTPYSVKSSSIFRSPPPLESKVWNYAAYENQARVVLEHSASLNDERKMKAELFSDRFRSFGYSAIHITGQENQSFFDWIHYDFMLNVAAFDTAIAIWQEKYRHDSVRPFSAISFIYGDSYVSAWGGVGEGTVSDLRGKDWNSYIEVPDHPAYPSSIASLCSAHAAISRMFFESDKLTWNVFHAKGSSEVEPGITPSNDISSTFETWTDWETDCGESRLWGGVQFPASISAGQSIGKEIAKHSFDFILSHMLGKPEQ